MFVQMFTAKVTNRDAVRAVLQGWPSGAGRLAKGWLGSTAGITDDGELVALARFESEYAALPTANGLSRVIGGGP